MGKAKQEPAATEIAGPPTDQGGRRPVRLPEDRKGDREPDASAPLPGLGEEHVAKRLAMPRGHAREGHAVEDPATPGPRLRRVFGPGNPHLDRESSFLRPEPALERQPRREALGKFHTGPVFPESPGPAHAGASASMRRGRMEEGEVDGVPKAPICHRILRHR